MQWRQLGCALPPWHTQNATRKGACPAQSSDKWCLYARIVFATFFVPLLFLATLRL